MSTILNDGGGASLLPRFVLILLLCSVSGLLFSVEPAYRGFLDYFDEQLNTYITMDSEGNITMGDEFPEGKWRLWPDPRGILALAADEDYSVDDSLKWYRIEGEEFVESLQRLPAPYNNPIVWTDTPFRVIIGHYPHRVWQLDPHTLTATLLCEYLDSNAVGSYASYVPDLKYVFYNPPSAFDLRRVNYDDSTGQITGPATVFPTPYRGGFDMASTSDGRYMVAIDASSIMVHRIDDEGTPHTTSYKDAFGMGGLSKVRITPDDTYVIILSLDNNTVNSFELLPSGELSPVTQWVGFELAQALAITPDGEYLVVAHHFYSGYPRAILSVFWIAPDGGIFWLSDKDVYHTDTIREITFFPPPDWPTPARSTWTMYY